MPATVASMNSVKIMAQPEACTQLLHVPVALLTIILQYVPLQERLGACTRVCRSFHAAAVAATKSISIVPIKTQARCDDVIEWLRRHGSGVTALKAQCTGGLGPFLLARLPCPLLLDVDLFGLSLQPGFLTACTSLTRLLLSNCGVEDSPHATSSADGNLLMQLSVLTSLQHLGLSSVSGGRSATKPYGTVIELPSSLLCRLPLTYLQLGYLEVQSDAALQHLSALTALQHLDLGLWGHGPQPLTAAALTGMQHLQHLTAFEFSPFSDPWVIDLHSMPALTALTALRVLRLLRSTSIDPAVLAGFRQLQQLELTCSKTWDAEVSAALLAAVGQQPQLTLLQLRPGYVWSTSSAAAFSALTASSHLQHLEVLWCDLPVGAWQHMFPPNRCLPELRHLCLRGDQNEFCSVQQLSHGDVQAMASCCPALVSLELGRQLAVTAAPLGVLTALTSLWIRACFQENAPTLAQLTGLQRLLLCAHEPGEQVTVSRLLELTVLQQLQSVGVMNYDYEPGLASSVIGRTMGVADSEQGRMSAVALGQLHAWLSCSICKALRHCWPCVDQLES